VADWRSRLPAFRSILEGLVLSRILEVGCNRGHNLATVAEIVGPAVEVVGVEPNRHALGLARQAGPQVTAVHGHVLNLPFEDDAFDLVFTAGVLIHVALEDLAAALREIHRVSRRYILAIEYFAGEETAIEYWGRWDLLWKRDFLAHYERQFSDLRLLRDGYWGPEDGFDRTHWWLLEKAREGRP
jgi:pseudaminic acid biosynthesis-associated methylase